MQSTTRPATLQRVVGRCSSSFACERASRAAPQYKVPTRQVTPQTRLRAEFTGQQLRAVTRQNVAETKKTLRVYADNSSSHLRGKPTRTHELKLNLSRRPHANVLGLGQAMVDFAASVDDSLLEKLDLGVEKGSRLCIDHVARAKVLDALDGSSYKLSAGGSLSNTLVALSRLGELGAESPSVSVACSLGPDALGDFYRNKLRRAGVQVLSVPSEEGTTGSVIVLTTPDANRTMLSCWGTSATLDYSSILDSALDNTGVLMIEGYLWEMPDTIATIKRAIAKARAKGTKVALTASDVSCIERHGEEFWGLIESGDVDILFANADEAEALSRLRSGEAGLPAALDTLSAACSMLVVTDGKRGSYLVDGSKRVHVPVFWTESPPVDTCGAGDSYAAGVLYGYITGADLQTMGEMGAATASMVISHSSARLSMDDVEVLNRLPVFAKHLAQGHSAGGGWSSAGAVDGEPGEHSGDMLWQMPSEEQDYSISGTESGDDDWEFRNFFA